MSDVRCIGFRSVENSVMTSGIYMMKCAVPLYEHTHHFIESWFWNRTLLYLPVIPTSVILSSIGIIILCQIETITGKLAYTASVSCLHIIWIGSFAVINVILLCYFLLWYFQVLKLHWMCISIGNNFDHNLTRMCILCDIPSVYCKTLYTRRTWNKVELKYWAWKQDQVRWGAVCGRCTC